MVEKPRRLYPGLAVDALYTAFMTAYEPHFNFPGESHEMWELGCVLTGRMGITSGSNVYECEPYEMVIHPGGIFHTSWTIGDENSRLLTVSFSGDGLDYLVPRGKFILNERERRLVMLLCEEVSDVFESDDRPAADAKMAAETEQIIKNLLEALCLSLNRRKSEAVAKSSGEGASRFAEIAQYMKHHVAEALDTDRICAECGIGKSALKELFRRYTGGGAMKYFNYLRIRHIVQLLSRGMTMAEIAREMNFSSQNYLTDFFKRETGMTPSAYRREKLG